MAVTAYSARGDEERIRAAGAQAYVSKPISVVRFAETVDELLKSEAPGPDDPESTRMRGTNRNDNPEGRALARPAGRSLKPPRRLT